MGIPNLKNKKIAVIGLSVEGTEALKYFAAQNIKVAVFDRQKKREFGRETLSQLLKYKPFEFFGRDYLENLNNFDLIVRTPGMPFWHKKLVLAKKQGTEITSLTKIFFDVCPCPIIGVTGTKGKGTTATLIADILKNSGKKVFLGGNLGNPLINNLPEITKNHQVVLELSSFQLEDMLKSPHLAVVLNITSEHLYSSSKNSPNYHQSKNDYLHAKENIVRYQNAADFAVLNMDYTASKIFKDITPAQIWYFSKKTIVERGAFLSDGKIFLRNGKDNIFICDRDKIILRGEHNLENINAAITASYLGGADIKSISQTVVNFKGLEHRLEIVRSLNGISFYNDSFATTPETTIAAIKSFSEPIILIAGGSEKKSDYHEMGKAIAKSTVKKVFLIGQTARRIEKKLLEAGFGGSIVKGLKNMEEIVSASYKSTNYGDVVLLSPGCASFGLFKNYKDRGEQFKYQVKFLT